MLHPKHLPGSQPLLRPTTTKKPTTCYTSTTVMCAMRRTTSLLDTRLCKKLACSRNQSICIAVSQEGRVRPRLVITRSFNSFLCRSCVQFWVACTNFSFFLRIYYMRGSSNSFPRNFIRCDIRPTVGLLYSTGGVRVEYINILSAAAGVNSCFCCHGSSLMNYIWYRPWNLVWHSFIYPKWNTQISGGNRSVISCPQNDFK